MRAFVIYNTEVPRKVLFVADDFEIMLHEYVIYITRCVPCYFKEVSI